MMHRAIISLLFFTLILSHRAGTALAAQVCDEPECFLRSVPSHVLQDTLIVGANLSTPPEHSWRLLLNDSLIFESSKAEHNGWTPFRVALKFREGDNVIELDSMAVQVVQYWRAHIYRVPEVNSKRFALVVNGASTPDSRVPELAASLESALTKNGAQVVHAGKVSEFLSELYSLPERVQPHDQVLIYYLGVVLVDGTAGGPSLRFEDTHVETPTMRLSNVIREISELELPSVSLVVDAVPLVVRQENNGPQFTPSNRDTNRWLDTSAISRSQIEIVLPNAFLLQAQALAGGGFTERFIEQMNRSPQNEGSCTSLRDVVQRLQYSPGSSLENPSVYFSPELFQSYCLSNPTNVSSLAVEIQVEDSVVKPNKRVKLSITLPPKTDAKWLEIWCDGVIVHHLGLPDNSQNTQPTVLVKTAPVSFGEHLVTVRIGNGFRQIAAKSLDIPVGGTTISSARLSDEIIATAPTLHSSSTIVRTGLAKVHFVISDPAEYKVAFSVRNNGVVLRRDYTRRFQEGDKVIVNFTLPLALGINRITIEVNRKNVYRESSTVLFRRRSDPVRAVLIGVGDYQSIPRKTTGDHDADWFRELALNYTNAGIPEADGSQSLKVLKNSDATHDGIINAIMRKDVASDQDPFLRGSTTGPTLLMYFAGLGGKNVDENNQPINCILPYDSNEAEIARKCISYQTVKEMISLWPNVVFILDTSFDGSAQALLVDKSKQPLLSRTLQDFVWRGFEPGIRSDRTAQPNRLILAASDTNVAALESSDLGHGLFTYSFVHAVEKESLRDNPMDSEENLESVFQRARSETASLSQRHQNPIMTGVLSHPFVFSETNSKEIEAEATAILASAKQDFEAMRIIDPNTLDQGYGLLSKAALMQPADLDSLLRAKVELLLYEDNTSAARADLPAEGLLADKSETALGSKSRAEWLRLRAEIRMADGELDSALGDAEHSNQLVPDSMNTLYTLAVLHATHLQYSESYELFDGLLQKTNPSQRETFTDEQWARIIVWHYLSYCLAHPESQSPQLLKRYIIDAKHHKGGLFLRGLGGLGKFAKIISGTQSPQVDASSLDEDWWIIVANYLLNPKKYENQMAGYRQRSELLDPKEPQAFDCMLHFYRGASGLIRSKPGTAKSEFQAVLGTKQKRRPEYWVAEEELSKLQGRLEKSAK
jgi:hypothetical protein